MYALQEPIAAYHFDFEGEKEALRAENMLLWDIFPDI
jgi:hypothetical protein